MQTEIAFLMQLQTVTSNVIGRDFAILSAKWFIVFLGFFVVMTAIVAHKRRLRIAAREAIFAGAFAAAASLSLGYFFHRIRPFMVSSDVHLLIEKPLSQFSFPSTHASIAFALAIALMFGDKRIGAVALLVAFSVAIGRMLVGVHYPTDVLAGIALGTSCAFIVRVLHHLLRQSRISIT